MTTTPQHPQDVNEATKNKLLKLLFAYQRTNLPDVGSVGIHNRNNTDDIVTWFEQKLTLAEQRGYNRRRKESNSGKLIYQTGLETGREAEQKRISVSIEKMFEKLIGYTRREFYDKQTSEFGREHATFMAQEYAGIKDKLNELITSPSPSDGADTKGNL